MNWWTTPAGEGYKPGTTRLDVAMDIAKGTIIIGLLLVLGLPIAAWLQKNATNPESAAYPLAHGLSFAAILGFGIWTYLRKEAT